MSQGRISPAMLMAAAAAMKAMLAPQAVAASTPKPMNGRAKGKINHKARPGYGARVLAFNSGLKKRMKVGFTDRMPILRPEKFLNASAGRSGAPARW